MEMRFDLFDRYAKANLKDTAFQTDLNSNTSHLFHLTLESLHHSIEWTQNASNAKGEPFDVVSGFTDLYSPNAFADRFDRHHVIGMHVPLFVAINEIALFCFSQAGFFPELGNAAAEISPAPWDDRVPEFSFSITQNKGSTLLRNIASVYDRKTRSVIIWQVVFHF